MIEPFAIVVIYSLDTSKYNGIFLFYYDKSVILCC